MFRWAVLADFLGCELLEVAYAMADGSYWASRYSPAADECGAGFQPNEGP